jgi:hypothetical protein
MYCCCSLKGPGIIAFGEHALEMLRISVDWDIWNCVLLYSVHLLLLPRERQHVVADGNVFVVQLWYNPNSGRTYYSYHPDRSQLFRPTSIFFHQIHQLA